LGTLKNRIFLVQALFSNDIEFRAHLTRAPKRKTLRQRLESDSLPYRLLSLNAERGPAITRNASFLAPILQTRMLSIGLDQRYPYGNQRKITHNIRARNKNRTSIVH